MKSILTEYTENCLICGKPEAEPHHLCFGRANRKLSDEDGLIIPVCRRCHEDIHNNLTSMVLSKMLGQLAWEKWYIGDFGDADTSLKTAREEYRKRYGASYL